MGQVSDLIALLLLVAVAGLWLKLSRARERATDEARRQCAEHGLQLLDETVGLRSLRLRKSNGQRVIERGYGFEVSIHGDDRASGRLWMIGDTPSGVSLPNGPATPPVGNAPAPVSYDNVIPLRPRGDRTLH